VGPSEKTWLHYTNLGFQMIGTMVVCALGGKYLDQYLEMKFPIFTLVLVLFGVFAALYQVLKDLLKK
jgi:F0F1-type ATP synthase assembly protein I